MRPSGDRKSDTIPRVLGGLGDDVHGDDARSVCGQAQTGGAADAAGGEHRHGGDSVDDLRDQHHGSDLAGVAASFAALGDDQVDPDRHVPLGVHPGAGQGTHLDALLVATPDHFGRR